MRLNLRELPLRPWSRWLDPARAPAELSFVETTDRVRLALHRIRRSPTAPDRGPVMLLHGLGANGFGFLLPQRSIAAWLASRGHDVFVPELRGAGKSGNHDWAWDLDDYLLRDLPAILEEIRRVTGRSTIRWVGHSMGGVLLCCYALRHPEHGIERGVAIGSALDYREGKSAFARLAAMRSLIAQVPVIPFGPFSHAVSPLLGRMKNPIDGFNF